MAIRTRAARRALHLGRTGLLVVIRDQ